MIVCALFELIFFALILSGSSSDDPRNFNDIWLPGFHFVPYPFNSINDPNGPFYDPIHGYYHLFYQYRTPRTWGHAASPNLVDWMQLPIALDRTEWYDLNGDFSGSATLLNDENRSIVLTVSTPEGHIFTAMPVNRSDPYLREWAYSDDPDASGTSQPLFTPDYTSRDPTEMFSLSQGGYQMFVGSEAGTQLWQVDSDDGLFSLDDWYNAGLAQKNPESSAMWECPDMFKLTSTDTGDVWVSKYSHNGDYFYTGEYDENTGYFTPGNWHVDQPQMYDQNTLFYASKSFNDPVGVGATEEIPRRVLFGWLIMTDSTPYWTEVWSNALSVPRSINIASNRASLSTYPIPELTNLHNQLLVEDETYHLEDHSLNSAASQLFDDVSGVMLDLEATVNMTQDSAGAELTCGFQFFVNINDDTNYLRVPIPYLETAGNVRNARILIDASIVEVYLDGGDTSLGGTTSYFYYPSSADYANFGIYMENKMISINSDSSSSRERSGDVDDDDYTTSFCDFEVHTVWSMDPFKFNASLYVF